MRTLTINAEGLEKLRGDNGLVHDQDLAARLGVNKGTVSRVIQGRSAPGPTFISAMLLTFPVKFEDIFDVVDDEESQASEAVRAA